MLATVLFAVSPVHAESVAIITSQSDLLVTISILATIICYLRWRREHKLLWLIGSILFEVIALGTKEVAAVTPLLILAWEFGRNRFNVVLTLKKPYWLITIAPVAIYLLIRAILNIVPISQGSNES